jgi:heme iron utilization protein
VVPFALDGAGPPLLFLSDLAVHTKALHQDPRCSLLVHDPSAADPQLSWRITLVARARIDDDRQAAFLARHPTTQLLPGFHTWALDVQRVRFIEGFGRMGWRDGLS